MFNKYITPFTLAVFLMIIASCCFSTKNTSLGDGYKLSEYSKSETEIMYCFDDCCNSGLTVIPQTVVAYNFNDNWIIAKQNNFAYWILKKELSESDENRNEKIKSNLIGPLDAETFYRTLSEKGIHLELINY